MGLKPYIDAPGVFTSGDLRKSFHSGGLNKSRELSGGGSGYRSEARRTPIGDGKYHFRGVLLPTKVVKTTIYYTKREVFETEILEGEVVSGVTTTVKSISQPRFIEIKDAFNIMPFTFKVVYTYGSKDQIGEGDKVVVTNVNIR